MGGGAVRRGDRGDGCERRSRRRRRCISAAAGLAFLAPALTVCAASSSLAATQTTTTVYQYNADGALTAVTTQVDAEAPSTVYLTWDNFVPSATTPSAGTVLPGNGNLLGIGSTPGGGFTTEFQYDARNRLTGAATAGAQSTAYTYHPASLMASSTLASGDALRFYYGVNGVPHVVNINQPASSTWTSYLGDTTYLNDGTEAVLCRPRKDVAGVYQAGSQSFTANRYDPYGASQASNPSGAEGSTYHLKDNPFLYSGEYRDPSWGGYYFRGRWYDPGLQVFTGRDPLDAVHRYGYGGGNPIGNVDPTGFSYARFGRDIDRHFRPLTGGLFGYITPLLPIVGQVAGGATLIANLPQVWNHPTVDDIANFAFLGASAVAEGASELWAVDRLAGSAAHALYARSVLDVAVGSGQAVFGNYRDGKWDVAGLVQSMEYNVGGIFSARVVSGFGYRPHTFTADAAGDFARQHFANGADDTGALVFRVRTRLARYIPSFTSPFLEWATLGVYHEGVMAISEGKFLFADVGENTFQDKLGRPIRGVAGNWISSSFTPQNPFERVWQATSGGTDPQYQFQYVGRFARQDIAATLSDPNGQGYPTKVQQRLEISRNNKPAATAYNIVTWNCHDYARGMIYTLMQPRQ